MPTLLTHPALPLALGLGLGRARLSPRLLAAGVLASMLPDLDVLAFRFGIAYEHAYGHRGFSHSLAFALGMALLAALLARRLQAGRWAAAAFVFVCTASHGLLDMLTSGGKGVALWWPLSEQRLFFPWQVIQVSPIGLERFFSARGLAVLQSELLWVWLPGLTLALLLGLGRMVGWTWLASQQALEER